MSDKIGHGEHHRLLIQPLSMPSLIHTGVSTRYDASARPLMRSDGTLNSTLRHHLNPNMYVNEDKQVLFCFNKYHIIVEKENPSRLVKRQQT